MIDGPLLFHNREATALPLPGDSYVNAEKLLERLRDPSLDAPLSRLADLAVNEWLNTTVSEWLEPTSTARMLRSLLCAWLASDEADAKFQELLEDGLEALAEAEGSLEALLPLELSQTVAALAERPFAPSHDLVLALLDREPIRKLLRRLLTDALVGFGRKLRAPVAENRFARGLGGLGRFARDQAVSRAGTLGTLATGVVGAVSDEVERQLERRAAEFADAAMSETLQKLAGFVSDPKFADEQAELRLAFVEGIFELSAPRVAGEIERSDPANAAAILRGQLSTWLRRDGTEEKIASAIEWLAGRDADSSIGTWLDEVGLRGAVVPLARELILGRIRTLVAGDAFGLWLAELLAAR